MFQRREGPAAAARPVAQAAGQADRYRSAFEVEPVGVDEIAGMGDVAAQGDDVDRGRLTPARAGLADHAGDAEEGGAVGQPGDLDLEPP